MLEGIIDTGRMRAKHGLVEPLACSPRKGNWVLRGEAMPREDIPQGGLQHLEETLRRRICSVCVDRSLEGNCHLEEENGCTLFSSFPKIVQAVSSVQSDLIEDYVAAIRRMVCAETTH